jgi:predicted metal-dependent enzyme (double-stranded beta helix superfamily)
LLPLVPLDATALSDVVRGFAADESLWVPRVRFGTADRRWWSRLHGDGRLDVWLLTWLPGHTTTLHDHGGSAAAYAVVQGALEEVRVADDRLSREVMAAGSVVQVAPDVVHDVTGTGPAPAVSIHAYSPPLRLMTYYDLHDGRLRRTHDVVSDEPEQVAS